MDTSFFCYVVIDKGKVFIKLFGTVSIDDSIINLVTADKELGWVTTVASMAFLVHGLHQQMITKTWLTTSEFIQETLFYFKL